MAGILSFGYDSDGGLGDRLLAAVVRGEKTATSSLAVEYLSGEPLPRVGERLSLVDHGGRPHGVVDATRVTIVPLHLVGDDVARDEGEGFADAAQWRQAHVAFWAETADLVRADAGDPEWQLREAEPVVVHWFRLLEPVQHLPRARRPNSRSMYGAVAQDALVTRQSVQVQVPCAPDARVNRRP